MAAIVFAFGSGIAMSLLQTRVVMTAGSLMPMHAAGFHGIQAVPLIALLLGWSRWSASAQERLTHAAGVAWLVLCAGLFWQAMAGLPPDAVSTPLAFSAAGFSGWLISFSLATVEYTRRHAPRSAPCSVCSGVSAKNRTSASVRSSSRRIRSFLLLSVSRRRSETRRATRH